MFCRRKNPISTYQMLTWQQLCVLFDFSDSFITFQNETVSLENSS